MIILAIETSCDDTCLAVARIKDKKLEILSNIVSSQIKIHEKYGGVYPSLAKREHQRNLPLVLIKTLKQSKFSKSSISAVAVTIGPGLEPCLWTGINFAKDIAKELNIPIIPVNHIEAHILANFIGSKSKFQNQNFKKLFPAIALIVSGGHTQLILVRGIGKYKILGETRDDAAGECFDKTARILGLGYPGGPKIAKHACAKPGLAQMPRPMINAKNYDFSFSGLKTAVLYHFKSQTKKTQKSKKYIQAMCFEIQQAIIDVLIKKTKKAALDYSAKTIIVGGGVSANQELRKHFKKEFNNILFPKKEFSTDNAAMIAVAGHYNLNKKTKDYSKIEARANLKI